MAVAASDHLLYELKYDLDAYLRDWAKGTAMHSSADIIAFNTGHAERALRFGQDIFLAAESSSGDLDAVEYVAARRMDIRAARTLGIDAYMDAHKLDAILFPGRSGSAIAAKAGYPSVLVPAGMTSGGAGERRRITRSARPLRGGPGASQCCCASPMRSSRPPGRGAYRRACRRSNRVAPAQRLPRRRRGDEVPQGSTLVRNDRFHETYQFRRACDLFRFLVISDCLIPSFKNDDRHSGARRQARTRKPGGGALKPFGLKCGFRVRRCAAPRNDELIILHSGISPCFDLCRKRSNRKDFRAPGMGWSRLRNPSLHGR